MGYTTGHKWTKKEVDFLKANFQKMSNKELATHFRVSNTSIEHKLQGLKLKRPKKVVGKYIRKGILANKEYMKRRKEYGRALGNCLKGKSEYKERWKISQTANPEIRKHREEFGKRMHQDPLMKAKMVQAIRSSPKFRKHNIELLRKVMSDPILNARRVAALRSAKSSAEHRRRISAEGNPMWKGGLSFIPYTPEFNKLLKDAVLKEFNNACQVCGIRSKRKLDVHHINYNKSDNKLPNLVCLCKSCHSKTNTDRDYWFAFFHYKLSIEPEELME